MVLVIGVDYSLKGEADGRGIEGFLGVAGIAEDGQGDVIGGVVVFEAQRLVRGDVAETLQDAEYLAALGEVGGARHNPQVH